MPKSPELDYNAAGNKTDGQLDIYTEPEHSVPSPESIAEVHSEPENNGDAGDFQVHPAARPSVQTHLAQEDFDWDRTDAQAQTTNGLGTRERAGTLSVEDTDRKAGQIAKQMLATQPPKPKRKKSTDGPPPHVRLEVRRNRGELI